MIMFLMARLMGEHNGSKGEIPLKTINHCAAKIKKMLYVKSLQIIA